MKERLVVGNAKSNQTSQEARAWVEGLRGMEQREDMLVVFCPGYLLLHDLKGWIEQEGLPINLGAQDISPFKPGAYTGEVNGQQLKEVVDYVIVGHSERRTYLGETDEMIKQKIRMASTHGIIPILCIQNEQTPIPEGVAVVAYEPVSAIGTGNPDTPENANRVAQTVKEKSGVEKVLYGGSVKPENVAAFLQMPDIDGVLVGGASLDPQQFHAIIQNA